MRIIGFAARGLCDDRERYDVKIQAFPVVELFLKYVVPTSGDEAAGLFGFRPRKRFSRGLYPTMHVK